MDTHDKNHHSKEASMTSQEWQQLIDDTAANIAAKESRLAALANEKAAAITDPKKLTALEHEEVAIPIAVESLKKRLPLLHQELEAALRTEAAARYGELEKLGEEATAQVNASTQAIRVTMKDLLAQIERAHDDWGTEAALFAEAEYLRVRFGLSASQGRAGDRFSPVELRIFIQQLERDFRHVVPTPWDGLRSEWQEAQRRNEARRIAAEDSRRPTTRPYIYFHRVPARP